MDPVRKSALEVCHQLDVVAVVAAEVLEVVGKALTARKVLLEAGEAAGERMPPGVDDPRVRQHELNQTHVQPIVGILVYEEGRPGLALHAGRLEVAGAERVHCVAVEPGQHFWKARTCLARARIELMHDPRNVRELHGPFDQGVTGEDLLEQRGSGPRKSDDEYRVRSRAAPARAGGKEISREQLLQAADEVGIIVGTVRVRPATQCIPRGIVRKGFLVGSGILQRLAEREFEMHAIVVCQILASERRAHGARLLVGEAKGLQVGKAPVGFAESRDH